MNNKKIFLSLMILFAVLFSSFAFSELIIYNPGESVANDTYIDKFAPNTNYGGSTDICWGTDASQNMTTLFNWDTICSNISGKRIDNMILQITNFGTPQSYPNVSPITSAWTENNVTYNLRPSINATFNMILSTTTRDASKRFNISLNTSWMTAQCLEPVRYGFALYNYPAITIACARSSATGVVADYPTLYLNVTPLDISNTSFNVTNYPDLISNSTAWNSNGYANVSRNLVTATFSTSIPVNASCSLSNLNYTQMVALNPNYKLATTQTTSHSFTLFDNLTLYQNQCIYCAYFDGTRSASSGCLKTMYSDIYAPNITRTSQVLPDMTTTNTFGRNLTINFNIIDQSSLFNIGLFSKVNYSDSDFGICTSGICSNSIVQSQPAFNVNSNYTFNQLEDNEILPASYNINEDYMENTLHSLITSTDYFRILLLNVSRVHSYGIFEAMINSTTANTLTAVFCNSSYSTGNIAVSPNCAVFSTDTATDYNHTHSQFSKHKIFPFSVVNGAINGIGVSPNSYFILFGTNAVDIRYIANNTATFSRSANNGNSWTAITGTADSHIHQYDNRTTFYYYACANDTYGHYGCSQLYSDTYGIDRLAPSSVVFTNPQNITYDGLIPVNYSASIPYNPSDSFITYYLLAYTDENSTFIGNIANNSNNLGYIWNTSGIPEGKYKIRVQAFDNFTLSSLSFSTLFSIDQNSPTCSGLNYDINYQGYTASITATIRDTIALSNVSFVFNDTIVSTTQFMGTEYLANNTLELTMPVNTTITFGYNFSDGIGRTGSCRTIATIKEFVPAVTQTIFIGGCPDTIPNSIMLGLAIFISFAFFYMAFKFQNFILGAFGSLLLSLCSWYMIGCIGLFAGILLLIGVIMFVYFLLGFKNNVG